LNSYKITPFLRRYKAEIVKTSGMALAYPNLEWGWGEQPCHKALLCSKEDKNDRSSLAKDFSRIFRKIQA
jgi:hypothetical protein